MKTLVIAEKPSVGRELAKVMGKNLSKNRSYIEGENYIFIWGYGHLLGLPNPDFYNPNYKSWRLEDLPFQISKFKFVPSSGKSKQVNLIKKLINRDDVDQIVNACDSDREGELIFRLVYNHSKSNKPTKRLWISTLTKNEIEKAFNNLKPSKDYDGLYQEAKTRSIADWIMGMNLSRLYTLKLGETFSVGRVQTPTLAFIVNREKEINAFIPDDYYQIEGAIDGIQSRYFKGEDINNNKFDSKEEAKDIFNEIIDGKNDLIITSFSKEDKTKTAPKLYDLGDLQGQANKHFGYSPKQTLDIAQNLYEKKLTSYPRTDCAYIKADQIKDLEESVKNLKLSEKEKEHINSTLINIKIVNDKKVEAHHGLMITNLSASLSDTKEKNIYNLIKERCLMQFADPNITQNIEVVSETERGHKFYTKGKTTNEIGWKFFSHSISKETLCPNHWGKGVSVILTELDFKEKQTQPPSRFNGKTLQEEMKKFNIGTAATQGGIIETLKGRVYIKKKGKVLYPETKGILLINIVNDALKTPETTKIMEDELKKIEEGNQTSDAYLDRIGSFTSEIIKVEKETNRQIERSEVKKESIVGKCPLCGSNVLDNKGNYFCSAPKEKCSFALWKNDNFWKIFNKSITNNRAISLLKNGKVFVKGLKGKKNTFDAYIVLKPTPNGKYNYQWDLEFKKK